MRKKQCLIIVLASLVLLGVASCEEKMVFQLADDPGYVKDPVVGIRALDGDRWIEGSVDQENRLSVLNSTPQPLWTMSFATLN